MATIKVCDRCGEKINPPSSVTYCVVTKNLACRETPVELCVSCAMWLRRYLAGEAEIEKEEKP